MAKILLTREGYEEILKELRMLSGEERSGLVQEIVEATLEWGATDDPDFQRILAKKKRLERRIQYLQEILANAEVQVGSNLPPDKVRFNCQVTIRHLANGKVQQFRLVGPVEADAANGRLSMASPLGRALIGRVQGDRVDLDTPAGRRSYQILDISVDEA
jgi:transcription elongation factor GreA